MERRPPAGASRRATTSEIDDGWVLPDEPSQSRPMLVTESAPAEAAASAAADGWPLDGGPSPRALDLNAATADELVCLPGVGLRKAKVIVDRRARRGPFRSVEELADLTGFGPKLVASLAEHVRV